VAEYIKTQLENLKNEVQTQQPKAIVLQQPNGEKVYFDIQHSTDTTAIWSFLIAMVVAFILGISATIIAIWYGRKSFQLTEMSFKTVVEEIKASQQSALDLNNKLFEQQRYLQVYELEEKRNQIWISEVRNNLSEYLKNYELLRLYFWFFDRKYYVDFNTHLLRHENFENENSMAKMHEIQKIHELSETFLINVNNFDVYLNNSDEHRKLFSKAHKVVSHAKQILSLLIKEHSDKKLEEMMEIFTELHLDFLFSIKEILNKKAA
jgi:hypothetical protein